MIFLQTPLPEVPIDGDTNKMYAFIIGCLLGALVYVYVQKEKITKDHKIDLKLFGDENKSQAQKLSEILNKLHLSLEEGKLENANTKKDILRVITLLENLKDKSNV